MRSGLFTCVLVDDQFENIDRLERLLNSLELTQIIGKAVSPEEGIKIILDTRPELVFLDVEMPRASGFEVVAELKRQDFHPKIVFVTAYDQYAVKAIKEQAFDYLLKPVDIDELKETLLRFSRDRMENRLTIPTSVTSLLTEREQDVLSQLTKGLTSKEIADVLFISPATVNTHRQNILMKTNKRSVQELIASIITASR